MDKDFEYYRKACAERQAQYNETPKQVLRVVFSMATPFSTTQHIRLDSLIARQSLVDVCGDDFFNLPQPGPDNLIDAPAPFEKCENEKGQWWWACSFGLPSLHRDQVTRWKKRWDDQHDDYVKFEKKLPRVDHKAGFFKAYDMPIVLKNAREIVFCCVGSPGEIEKLLKDAHHIGKKRSQGYGEIRKITVEESSENWSCFWPGQEGRAASRAIPLGIDQNQIVEYTKKIGGMTYCTYNPPYWMNAKASWCYPIVMVKNDR